MVAAVVISKYQRAVTIATSASSNNTGRHISAQLGLSIAIFVGTTVNRVNSATGIICVGIIGATGSSTASACRKGRRLGCGHVFLNRFSVRRSGSVWPKSA